MVNNNIKQKLKYVHSHNNYIYLILYWIDKEWIGTEIMVYKC